MKPQDIAFILVFAVLLYHRKPTYFILAGVLALVAAIPLFAAWVFFTAEHLTWYAAAFFFVGCLLLLRDARRVQ